MNTTYNVTKGSIAYCFDAKLANMRKSKDWVIYPVKDVERIIIQCDTRIATLNLVTGKGRISANKPNGAYAVHLSFGATDFDVPKDLVEAIMDSPVMGTHAVYDGTSAKYTGAVI